MTTASNSARPRASRAWAPRFDLGLRALTSEWKAMTSREHLRADLGAGLVLACVAIPLSLAIALASGVDPATGLVTAIVGGIVCAFFGGTRLAVSGPAAAMAVLVASVIQENGLGGLLVVTLGAGLLQLATGVFRAGRIIRFVPVPVIAGFTAGVGAIILLGQLPRALGLPPPDQAHVVDVVQHLGELLPQSHLPTLFITLLSLALLFGTPRFAPKIPAALVAVLVPTLVALVLPWPVATLGALPAGLPLPSLPALPTGGLLSLLAPMLAVYALASLETLLSSAAVDKLARGPRHDPDQELVGQGLGNVASALFGGIPVTGVIARSALNVQSGAKTRRAAIVHALLLVASVFVLSPLMARIPIAALAGVLLSVALRMLHPRELLSIWRTSRQDAAVYAITFVTMVAIDLIVGVQAGIVAALVIAAIRFGQVKATMLIHHANGPFRLAVHGPVTFLSSGKIDTLRDEAALLDAGRGVVLELSDVPSIDASGGEQLVELIRELRTRGCLVAIQGAGETVQRRLVAAGADPALFAVTESEASRLVSSSTPSQHRLEHGVERFRHHFARRYGRLFERLASSQEPHTLFITCSDSRINPNLLTSTDPGELFIVRTVGNLVPDRDSPVAPAITSAVEYAVSVLGVNEIVVCAHSGCGAMQALRAGTTGGRLPGVDAWLEGARAALGDVRDADKDDLARRSVLVQLDNLRRYPSVAEGLAAGRIRVRAWNFDVGRVELFEHDLATGEWRPVGETARALERARAGVQHQRIVEA